MADDRHFENGFISISQLQIIRFQWNLVCRCIIWFQERSFIKVSKFCKFKMADGRFVCERLYVSLQISWVFWVNRRCPPIFIVIQGKISDLYPLEILKVRHNINPYPIRSPVAISKMTSDKCYGYPCKYSLLNCTIYYSVVK